jgi:hypothetical protein
MNMQWIKTNTRTTIIATGGNIILDEYSNGFTIKNIGNSVLFINHDPLQPTESKGFGGHLFTILTGRYAFTFDPIASPPPGYVQDDNAVITEYYFLPTAEQAAQFNC